MLGELKFNRRGGIEGLPLQLMIVIMVATMGAAVIMDWMGDIDTPHYIRTIGIEENVVIIEDGSIPDIHVCVLNENNEPMQGVTVYIANTQAVPEDQSQYLLTTDSKGNATLSGWTLEKYPISSIKLSIVAYKSGYDKVVEEVEGLIR